MENKISKIGVFTSGGDAPGMNAAIRAVVRACTYYKKSCVGIMRGYEGMIEGDTMKLDARSVGNIIQRGGTILKSARSKEFRTIEGRQKAAEHIKKQALTLSLPSAVMAHSPAFINFLKSMAFPRLHPGTIDNDLAGTDYTIGYDTATNTAVEPLIVYETLPFRTTGCSSLR